LLFRMDGFDFKVFKFLRVHGPGFKGLKSRVRLRVQGSNLRLSGKNLGIIV